MYRPFLIKHRPGIFTAHSGLFSVADPSVELYNSMLKFRSCMDER